MSLILDALRKMEQDRKGRSGTAAVLRPDVLRYRARTAKRRRTTPYLLICGGVVVLAAGIAAGMFALGRHNAVPVAAGPSAPATSLAQSAPVPLTAPVTVPPAATAPPAPTTAQPTDIPAPAANVVAAAPSPAAAETSQLAAIPKEPKPVKPAKAKRTPLPQTRPERHDAAEPVPSAPQDITISGIAWQEERNLRRAVLNGTLVAEGAVVAGARVVEIKEDRVRLSRAGQSFEIPFSSALSAR